MVHTAPPVDQNPAFFFYQCPTPLSFLFLSKNPLCKQTSPSQTHQVYPQQQRTGSVELLKWQNQDPEQIHTHFDGHDLVAGFVHHFVDGAVRASADLAQVFEILGGEVPVLLRGDLQFSRGLDAVRPQPLSDEDTRPWKTTVCWMCRCVPDVTHMCGFWKGGPVEFRANLVAGLIGGLAKFSFRALRLPSGEKNHLITENDRIKW